MKRTERHHLKENELEKFARRAREAFETRRRETMAAVVALLVIGVVAIGYWAYRERVQTRAHALLAAALAVQEARVGPPAAPGAGAASTPSFATERERSLAALAKFKAAADAYPATDAGKREDAQQTFNRLVEEFPQSPFAGDAKRELDGLKKT